MHAYSEVTHNIQVDVVPTYLADQSSPEDQQYVFSYQVTITNNGNQTVQLISRHWIITDGNGHIEEVKGPGVIGEQPTLKPGQSHRYESFCPLATSMGDMRGTYQMLDENRKPFEIKIPRFDLRSDLVFH